MFTLINILIIAVAILLIISILLQEPKEDMTPSGGGSNPSQRIGFRQTNSFLEQMTWGLTMVFFVLILFSTSFIRDKVKQENISSPNIQRAVESSTLSPKEGEEAVSSSSKKDKE